MQPDTIVPGAANPQAYNRYSYVLNNPLRYTDPTGHYCVGDDEDCADEGGDGPAPTGTGGNNGGNGGGGGGGDPHDDDDFDPNPNCVGCGTGDAGGGHPLLSLSNIAQSCQSNPYCFYASEDELNAAIEVLAWQQDILTLAALAYGAIGAMAIETPIGWIILAVAGEFALEANTSGRAQSYLDKARDAALVNNGAIEIYRTESPLKTSYNYEGASAPYSVGLPITRVFMEIISATSSWDD